MTVPLSFVVDISSHWGLRRHLMEIKGELPASGDPHQAGLLEKTS